MPVHGNRIGGFPWGHCDRAVLSRATPASPLRILTQCQIAVTRMPRRGGASSSLAARSSADHARCSLRCYGLRAQPGQRAAAANAAEPVAPACRGLARRRALSHALILLVGIHGRLARRLNSLWIDLLGQPRSGEDVHGCPPVSGGVAAGTYQRTHSPGRTWPALTPKNRVDQPATVRHPATSRAAAGRSATRSLAA